VIVDLDHVGGLLLNLLGCWVGPTEVVPAGPLGQSDFVHLGVRRLAVGAFHVEHILAHDRRIAAMCDHRRGTATNRPCGDAAAGRLAQRDDTAANRRICPTRRVGDGARRSACAHACGVPAYSTRVRALVSEGQIEEANTLVGHPTLISGVVQHGDERGRLLGFPTANLLPEPYRLVPADGVYAVRVHIQDEKETSSDATGASTVYNGVANIGIRPTFNGTERRIEVHIFDATLDLYGKRLEVDFIARLRGEQRFSGIEALKAQISSDAQQARQRLQN